MAAIPRASSRARTSCFRIHPPDGKDAALLASARKKLFDLRARRPRPHLDDKIVTAWNGLMISAFARASRVLDDPAYLDDARRAADFLRQHLYRPDDGILLRSYREGPASVEGFADDYAFLIQGLLDLYEAGFDPAHLRLGRTTPGETGRTLPTTRRRVGISPPASGTRACCCA